MPGVFSKIISGELPAYKLYEDDLTLAFLSKEVINIGHSMIVPKIEIDYFVDVPEPYYSAVFLNAKPLSIAIQKATECKRVGTVIHGFGVPHFHYHLIPMFHSDDLNPKNAKTISNEEYEEIQKKIIFHLDV